MADEVDRKGKVRTEEGEVVDIGDYLTREEGLTRQQTAKLIDAAYKRLETFLENKTAPYAQQAKEIEALRKGVYVLGRIIGVEVPTTVEDDKLDAEVRSVLSGYGSIPEALKGIIGRIDGSDNSEKSGGDDSEGSGKKGKSKKGKGRPNNLNPLDGVRRDLENLKSRLEGGDLYKVFMGAVEYHGEINNDIDQPEDPSSQSNQSDLAERVEVLTNLIRRIITDNWEGSQGEEYQGILDGGETRRKTAKK